MASEKKDNKYLGITLQNARNHISPTSSLSPTTLSVIGAGRSRTGTTSLQAALVQLGFGPVHHFTDCVYDNARCKAFNSLLQASIQHAKTPASDAEREKDSDKLAGLMCGYGSCVDSPTADLVPELIALYPKAKVVCTVRDSDEVWYASVMSTIGVQECAWFPALVQLTDVRHSVRLARSCFEAWTCGRGGKLRPELHGMYNARIKEVVPEGSLLMFNSKEGWGPLCEFLEVPVPEEPYPYM